MNNKKHIVFIGYVIIFISIAFFWQQPLFAYALLNRAQLNRLHGHIQPALYTRALAHAPHDAHIRWQTGEALAATGQTEAAADVLLPLAQQPTRDNQVTSILLNTLIAANRTHEAATIYQTLTEQCTLPLRTSAILLNGLLQQHTTPSPDITRRLLTRVFAVGEETDPYPAFAAQLTAPDFWQTELGHKVQDLLQWYARPIASNTVSHTVQLPDEHLVASLLQVTAENITYGQELVANGSFTCYNATKDDICNWQYSFMVAHEPFNLAAFVVGIDDTTVTTATTTTDMMTLRIDGLYRETAPERESARAGMWYKTNIPLKPATPYVMSFLYRTERVEGKAAAIWLTGETDNFWQHDKLLPTTNGTWQRVTIIGWNRTNEEATILPLLRSWGLGSVWFDDFTIREIILPPDMHVEPQEPIVHVENAK